MFEYCHSRIFGTISICIKKGGMFFFSPKKILGINKYRSLKVVLPKLFKWYKKDFGEAVEILRWILPFLPTTKRRDLDSLLKEEKRFRITFHNSWSPSPQPFRQLVYHVWKRLALFIIPLQSVNKTNLQRRTTWILFIISSQLNNLWNQNRKEKKEEKQDFL